MRKLIWKLVLPLTIISFSIYTKLWYGDIYKDSIEILAGFPLPYMWPGGHSSLAIQYFISEMIVDILTYFLIWFTITAIVNKYLIKLNKILTIVLLSFSGFLTLTMIWIATLLDNVFHLKRDFDVEILETNFKFHWQDKTRPDYYKYHPEIKKNTQ